MSGVLCPRCHSLTRVDDLGTFCPDCSWQPEGKRPTPAQNRQAVQTVLRYRAEHGHFTPMPRGGAA